MKTLYLAALVPLALGACVKATTDVPPFGPVADAAVGIRSQVGFSSSAYEARSPSGPASWRGVNDARAPKSGE
jgi:hypothetical protein